MVCPFRIVNSALLLGLSPQLDSLSSFSFTIQIISSVSHHGHYFSIKAVEHKCHEQMSRADYWREALHPCQLPRCKLFWVIALGAHVPLLVLILKDGNCVSCVAGIAIYSTQFTEQWLQPVLLKTCCSFAVSSQIRLRLDLKKKYREFPSMPSKRPAPFTC